MFGGGPSPQVVKEDRLAELREFLDWADSTQLVFMELSDDQTLRSQWIEKGT